MKNILFSLLLAAGLLTSAHSIQIIPSNFIAAVAAGDFPVIETYNISVADTAVNTLAVTKPSSSNDDLLLLICTSDATNATDIFETTEPGPDTWTHYIEAGNGTSDTHIAIYWRISDGTEASTATCDQTAGNDDQMVSWYLVISNVDTTTPINADGGESIFSSGLTQSITAATSTVVNTLAIYIQATDGFDTSPHSVSGTGWTETTEDVAGTAGDGVGSSWGEKEVASIGSSGSPSITVSVSNEGRAGIVILIAPP